MKHPEHTLQVQCVNWLRQQYAYLSPIFYSVPNGGYRNATTAAIMRSEGQRAGISDLCLDMPSTVDGTAYHGLRIEMKAGKGRQSDEQKMYESYCRITGYMYVVCYSFEQFMHTIHEYLAYADETMTESLMQLHKVAEEARLSVEKAKLQRKASSAACCHARKTETVSVSSARKELAEVLARQESISSPALRGILSMQS